MIILPEQRPEVARLHELGWSQKAIANHFGVNQPAISVILVNMGLRSQRKNFTPEEISIVVSMRNDGATYKEIADQLGSTRKTIESVVLREKRATA